MADSSAEGAPRREPAAASDPRAIGGSLAPRYTLRGTPLTAQGSFPIAARAEAAAVGWVMLQGHVDPDFWIVAKTFQKLIPRSGGGGAAVCVYHHGEKVVDLWAGTRDESGRPWEADTLALSYSTTKGVASTLLHILADRGLLEFDAPVARYWPEFARAGKDAITVRQLLSHQAGLFDIRSLVDDAHRMLDWDFMTTALAGAKAAHAPGAFHAYHGLTFGWLVGELVRRLTGLSFSEALAREIAEPLDLDGCYCGLPEAQMHRRALLVGQGLHRGGRSLAWTKRIAKAMNRGFALAGAPVDLRNLAAALLPPGIELFDMNSVAAVRASIPAANGMFTARSLAKLYALLANGGELDGTRLLSEAAVRTANTVQSRRIDRVVPFAMHWRLGFHRAPVARRVPHAFGHAGYGGSGGWADPDHRLAVALVLNSGVGTPFGDLRIMRVGNAALACAQRR